MKESEMKDIWELHTVGVLGNIWFRRVGVNSRGSFDVEYCVAKVGTLPFEGVGDLRA